MRSNRLKSRSFAGAFWWSWMLPGAGQLYLGQRRKGASMLALYLAAAIPAGVLVFTHDDLFPVVVACLPGMAIWIWSQHDIRRALGLGWRPLQLPVSQTLDGMKGRDSFYPDDPLKDDPERPI